MTDAVLPTTVPEANAALAGRLLADQFPQWADLPLAPVEPAGSDHAIYRLGDTMSVRLPLGDWAATQAEKEHLWLPRIAPHLPLAIPVPLGLGTPALGYPWHWSVTRWIDGVPATIDGFTDPERTAVQLAGFLTALHRLPPAAALAPGPHHGLTHPPLASRDHSTRADIAAVADTFDAAAMTEVWDRALTAPAWSREPVWFHGDFHTGNLLTRDGRLTAVIDFGGLGMGDPAWDLMIAYTLLTPTTRALFRAALPLDSPTWTRARGFALTTGLNAYTTYAHTHPRVAHQTHHQLTQALTDHRA